MILALSLPQTGVLAARGIPGSAEFGFGGFLHPEGQLLEDGTRLAGNIQLDWIAVEIPWQTLQTEKGGMINWAAYEPVISLGNKGQISILASISRPPQWAMTATGPDMVLSVQFINQVTQKFGPALQALELFPLANTRQGWGTDPNPQAYLTLFKAVQANFKNRKTPVTLVAGGLLPSTGSSPSGTVDDLKWLKEIYRLGGAEIIQVVSIQFLEITGSPVDASTTSESRVLRHYEDVRSVMVANGHEKGLVWITHLHPPANSASQQAAWLGRAFQQIRSQLYIGVAFLDGLNPSSSHDFSLILDNGEYHAAFRILRDQVAQNASGSLRTRPGRPKNSPLIRSR